MKVSHLLLVPVVFFANAGAGYCLSDVHGWNVLKIGAGGYLTTIDWPNSAAPLLSCGDVGGCYEFSGGKWIQLVTTASMPESLLGREKWLGGGYEIRSAPNDPTRCYLAYAIPNGAESDAHLLKSDNCNTPDLIKWTEMAGFTGACRTSCKWNANTQGGPTTNYKLVGAKMAVDPNNKDVIVLGTPHSGQFVTTNGKTFGTLKNVPASTSGMPASGIAFDNSSPHNCGAENNQTCVVWVCSYGNGCWRSSTGSTGTFVKVTTGIGPKNVAHGKVGIDGVYYATEADWSKTWRFTNTWTDISPPGSSGTNYTVTIYPTDATKIVITSASGAQSFVSNANSGTPSYKGSISGYPKRGSSDVPWFLASTNVAANSLNVGDAVMDPQISGKVWVAAGLGIWYSTSSSGTSEWNGISSGIEGLVTNRIVSPPGGQPVGAFWDRPFFYLSPLSSYKTGYGNSYGAQNDISMGWSVDYCTSTPTTIVGLNNWADNLSGYSSTSGNPNDPGSWNLYANFPNLVGTFIGGGIACSTPDNVVFAAANKGDVYYSKNATSPSAVWTKILASTWNHGVQQGNGTIDPGWGITYSVPHQAVCADRVTTGTFYAFNAQRNALGGGVYRSTDGGDTWQQQNTQFADGADSAGYSNRIYCVPGKAGHLFYTGGQNLSALYHSEDGGSKWPRTTSKVAITGPRCTPSSVYDVTTGATKPGNDYPSVYFVGVCGSTYGVWRSDNSASDWSVGTNISWTPLGLPVGYMDQPTTLAGDNNTWGQVMMGGKGTGAVYYVP